MSVCLYGYEERDARYHAYFLELKCLGEERKKERRGR